MFLVDNLSVQRAGIVFFVQRLRSALFVFEDFFSCVCLGLRIRGVEDFFMRPVRYLINGLYF